MGAVAPPGGSSATEASDTSGDDTRRRRWALLLIAVAFLLVVLGTVGVLYEGDLVLLNRLAHPFLFGCLAAAAFGVGARQLISTHRLRVTVTVATIAVGTAWFCLGLLVVSLFGLPTLPIASVDAPGDRAYQAVVHKHRSWGGDYAVYEVSIRQTRGLLSREWLAGCISNEGNGWPLHRVRWETPSRLWVTVGYDGYGITMAVDPRTGKPKSPAC